MIAFEHVTKRYGAQESVSDVSFTVDKGAFCAIVGTSGSGKSTTLRMINRLIEPSSGTIRLNSEDIATIPAESLRRRIGYAIQSVGLFPHCDRRRQHRDGAKAAGLARGSRPQRVAGCWHSCSSMLSPSAANTRISFRAGSSSVSASPAPSPPIPTCS